MAPSSRFLGGLLGVGLLLACSGSLAFTASFGIASPAQNGEQVTVSRFRGARYADAPTSSISGLPLWSIAVLSLAGVTITCRRRSVDVVRYMRTRNRMASIYGGEGPPKVPPFLEKGLTTHSGLAVPLWFTQQKWESFTAKNRARRLPWWIQAHDENGVLAFDPKKEYTIDEAVDILLAMNQRAPCTYRVSLEAHLQMNLDPRYPDQQVRTSFSLPHGTGKKVTVAVFCPEDEVDEVMAAGADKCGDDLAKEIANEQLDFDVLIAKPQMMPRLAKLGKILGPRRLMPSPKSGTVITDYAKSIKEFKEGKLEIRTDRYSMIHCGCGKLDFGRAQLIENFRAVLRGMVDNRPEGAKRLYFKGVYMGCSLSPSLRIKPSEFPAIEVFKK